MHTYEVHAHELQSKTYTPVRCTPMSFMAKRYMSIRCTLISFTPKRYTPVRYPVHELHA
jgi:ribosomal protein S27AE